MQNGMIDLYVRGNNSVAYSEIYSSFASEKNSYISDLLLLVINNDSSKVRKHGETYFTIRMGNRESQHNIIPKAKTQVPYSQRQDMTVNMNI